MTSSRSDFALRSIARAEDSQDPGRAEIAAAVAISAMAAVEAEAFSEPWSPVALEEIWGNPGARGWLAENPAGEVVGFILLRLVPAAREAELLRVATVPSSRRRGVAAGLLGVALAELDLSSMDCFLEVRADNHPAQELYRRFGFVQVQLRRAYYRDGSDAWVFARPA